MRDNCTDYRDLFLHDRAMMDTRAPVEFHKGAFPGVINLPLMTDIERQRVGTCYKQQGQQAAIELGHNWSAARPRPSASRLGPPLPRLTLTVTCTAFAVACARRSSSNG